MADKKISALTAATTPLAGTEVLPIVQSSATVKVAVSNLTAGRAVSVGSLTSAGNILLDGSGNPTITLKTSGAGNNPLYRIQADTNYWDMIGVFSDADDTYRIRYNNTDYFQINNTGEIKFTGGNITQGTAAKGVNFTANTPAAGMTSQLLNWYEEGTWTPTQGAGLTVVGAFTSSGRYTRVGRLVTIHGQLVGATSIAAANGGVITSGYPFTPAMVAAGTATTSQLAGCVTYLSNGAGSVIYANAALGAAGALYVTASYYV